MQKQELRELCLEYLEVYKKPFIKFGTYERYKCSIKYIPNIDIANLNCDTLQRIVNNMLAHSLSMTSIKHTVIIYKQTVRELQRRHLIDPFELTVRLPKLRKSCVRAFSEYEQQLIMSRCSYSHYGDLYLALMYTGCRVGELIALEWSDIDFKAGFFYVNKTNWKGHIGTPKTQESERKLPLSYEFRQILRRKYYVGCHGVIFRNTFGLAVNYRALLDSWHRFLDTIGITSCGLHTLRHTYATNALRAGVNYKVLSKLLGHSSVAVTMDIYCDIADDDKKAAAELLSNAYDARRKLKVSC